MAELDNFSHSTVPVFPTESEGKCNVHMLGTWHIKKEKMTCRDRIQYPMLNKHVTEAKSHHVIHKGHSHIYSFNSKFHFVSSNLVTTMASLLERMNLPTSSLSGPIRSKSQSNRGTAAPYVRAIFLPSQCLWYQR